MFHKNAAPNANILHSCLAYFVIRKVQNINYFLSKCFGMCYGKNDDKVRCHFEYQSFASLAMLALF